MSGYGMAQTTEHHSGTLTLAHNPSAFIGVVMCVFLLSIWFEVRAADREESE